jgi:hypothetical protein
MKGQNKPKKTIIIINTDHTLETRVLAETGRDIQSLILTMYSMNSRVDP